jgi:hypothetical protein
MIKNIILWGMAFYISIKVLITGYKLVLRNIRGARKRVMKYEIR